MTNAVNVCLAFTAFVWLPFAEGVTIALILYELCTQYAIRSVHVTVRVVVVSFEVVDE